MYSLGDEDGGGGGDDDEEEDDDKEEDVHQAVTRIQAIVRSRQAREQYLRLRRVTMSLQERVLSRSRGDTMDDDDKDDEEEEEVEEEEAQGGGVGRGRI